MLDSASVVISARHAGVEERQVFHSYPTVDLSTQIE